MPNPLPYPAATAGPESRSVLAIPAFRKLWNSMVFSSFGAQELSNGNYSKANFAIAGVFIVRLLPAVILGPIAGVIADRFDRRRLMVFCDIFRFGLYLSIPIVGNYFWLYTATVLVECFTLFWSPAKEATVPNMVPKNKLESANQVSLLAAYGTAPVAAIVFSLLALVSTAISKFLPAGYSSTADIAL
ncbi:MAG: MFS transporter, partial [Actinobacteria bacterium]|nr:MFS transporter [Actinomycetota bacterium]